MYGHEPTVVDHEEWDYEELAEVLDGLFDGGEGDFEDVVKSDDEIFGPVQEYDCGGVPFEEGDAVEGYDVCRDKGDDGYVGEVFFG